MVVSLYMEVDGTKSFSGTIECSDEENVTFDTNTGKKTFAIKDIAKTVRHIDF